MSERILVTYGTKHGSTRDVADVVAETLNKHGLDVETLPTDRVETLAPYSGVVLGGALYTGRWHPDAVRFLKRHRDALEGLPLAVFAMGPRTMEDSDVAASRAQLDNSLSKVPELEPVAVAVFGGVIDPAKLRFPFNRMPAIDARDWAAIRAFAADLAVRFDCGKAASGARDHRSELQQTPR